MTIRDKIAETIRTDENLGDTWINHRIHSPKKQWEVISDMLFNEGTIDKILALPIMKKCDRCGGKIINFYLSCGEKVPR